MYSLRMNQSVMYGNWLVVEAFNWKIERNKSGKKETTNRGGLTALKMHIRSKERDVQMQSMRPYKRRARSDGMMRGTQLKSG